MDHHVAHSVYLVGDLQLRCTDTLWICSECQCRRMQDVQARVS